MVALQEVMGQEIYDLLYTHYDKNNKLIKDMDDVLYCDDDEISQARILKLESLLIPIADAESSLVPIEAAKLLAAWGLEKGSLGNQVRRFDIENPAKHNIKKPKPQPDNQLHRDNTGLTSGSQSERVIDTPKISPPEVSKPIDLSLKRKGE